MRDGRTVKRATPGGSPRDALGGYRALLVVIEGEGAGTEHALRSRRVVVGRGPGVDLAFPDDEMSQQHAALEFAGGAFHVTDLGSTNGTRVNGTPVVDQELDHGDRLSLGRHVLQLVLEKCDVAPPTYVLPDA